MKQAWRFLLLGPWVFTSLVHAQDERGLYTGVSGAASCSYRTLRGDGSAASAAVVLERDRSEKPGMSYSVSLVNLWKLSPRFTLESGLQFTRRGYKTERIGVDSAEAGQARAGEAIYQYAFGFVDIPVKLNYMITESRLKPYLLGGVLVSVPFGSYTRRQFYAGDGSTTQDEWESNAVSSAPVLGVLAGVGWDYDIHKTVKLRAEALYQRSITPMPGTAPVREYLYGMGLNAGFFVRLG